MYSVLPETAASVVNTTDSAVRLTHFPSGIVISCQDEKSQLKNKDKALKILRARLYDPEQQKQHDEMAELRKSQVGTGDRSEKIRTYNFPQGRVTDHRIKLTLYKLDAIMNGDLDEIIGKIDCSRSGRKAEHAGRSIIINAANHDWSTGSIVDRINRRKKGKERENAMKKTALVIMAAGIGSRFGKGIKQLEPVGPNGRSSWIIPSTMHWKPASTK